MQLSENMYFIEYLILFVDVLSKKSMLANPNLTNMKNLQRSTVLLVAVSLLLFFGCTPEENESVCNCEEVYYNESKFQIESTDIWQLNRTEVSRTAIECQNETGFVRTGNSTEVRRIECN